MFACSPSFQVPRNMQVSDQRDDASLATRSLIWPDIARVRKFSLICVFCRRRLLFLRENLSVAVDLTGTIFFYFSFPSISKILRFLGYKYMKASTQNWRNPNQRVRWL